MNKVPPSFIFCFLKHIRIRNSYKNRQALKMTTNIIIYINGDPIQIIEIDDYIWYIDPTRIEVDLELKNEGKMKELTAHT
ncbi:MAG: hypothetical protein BAJALOKI1v1_910006 [Promethearchaeota archaeon]|nr:MAG: hypothetical protein BAJALOKI1v1_910006 [Candidatus Lokiarchaeota archaeon]